MAEGADELEIVVVAFGPLAERLGGRRHDKTVAKGTTIADIVVELGFAEWIAFGLSVAMNGDRCPIDTPVEPRAEIALLPPVSGG